MKFRKKKEEGLKDHWLPMKKMKQNKDGDVREQHRVLEYNTYVDMQNKSRKK